MYLILKEENIIVQMFIWSKITSLVIKVESSSSKNKKHGDHNKLGRIFVEQDNQQQQWISKDITNNQEQKV